MANPQLLDYMKTQMKNGWKKDDLLAAVRKAGWQESAIQEVIREMEPPPIRPATPPPAAAVLPQQKTFPTQNSFPAANAAAATAPIRSNPLPAALTQPKSAAIFPGSASAPYSRPAFSATAPQPAAAAPSRAVFTASENPAISKASATQPSPSPIVPHAKPIPQIPIAIDATGNPTTAEKIMVQQQPAIEVETGPATFGTPQRPQMQARPKPYAFPQQRTAAPAYPVQPARPIFSPSQVSREGGISGYDQTPAASAPVASAIPAEKIAPVASPSAMAEKLPASSSPIQTPGVSIPVTSATQSEAPFNKPVQRMEEPLPVFAEKITPATKMAVPMTVRMNPAFVPGARPIAAMNAPTQKPSLMAGLQANSLTEKPSASVSASTAIPGAFPGMRTNVLPTARMQTQSIGTGILPQGRAEMPLRGTPVQQTAQPKKSGKKLLIFLILILALLIAGGVIYAEFPATLQQATDSVQALIPSSAPLPDAILANAITKLLSSSRFSFKANVTGAVISAQDPQSNVTLQGTASGSVASLFPFPQSQNSVTITALQAGQPSPTLAASADVLTTSNQGAFLRLRNISGSADAGGAYDQLKNVWISADPAAIGLDKFSAIFGSQAFVLHQNEIRNIIVRSQIFAVASVYNDDPGSGLYHYRIAIQKDRILPAILQIASLMGTTVSGADQAAISSNIQGASFPAFEAWISQSSLTLNRLRMNITRSGAQAQNFSLDISLLPLVGNPPAIIAPKGAIPLAQIFNPAPAPTSTAPAKNPATKKN